MVASSCIPPRLRTALGFFRIALYPTNVVTQRQKVVDIIRVALKAGQSVKQAHLLLVACP